MVCRIFSPPGTSPTPVCPALSSRITMLRVKNGPCAPLRFRSMLSCPATGITVMPVTVGVKVVKTTFILKRKRFSQLFAVFIERFAACGRQAANGQRDLAAERLLDLHVPRLFEAREMARKVALGQPRLPLQEQEVRLGHRVQHRHDGQARRLVDLAVEVEHHVWRKRQSAIPPERESAPEATIQYATIPASRGAALDAMTIPAAASNVPSA